MNTNTKNIFGTSDGFVLIIRATRINNKLISGETISPVIYLVFLSQGGLYFSNTKKYIEPLVQDHSGPPDRGSLGLRPGLVPGATSASPRIIMVTSHLTPHTSPHCILYCSSLRQSRVGPHFSLHSSALSLLTISLSLYCIVRELW